MQTESPLNTGGKMEALEGLQYNQKAGQDWSDSVFVFCPFFMVCSLSLRTLPMSLIELTNGISKKNVFI